MKVAVYNGPEQIGLTEMDRPTVEPGYVLINVKACGICGSDLHAYFGEWQQKDTARGHELTGVIDEVGDNVDDYKPGDRVCVECFSHCGRCRYCRTGFYNMCVDRNFLNRHPGGFAEYCVAEAGALYALPDGLSFDMAALVEPLAVSYRAFRQSDAQKSLLIIGAGTIGLMALASATYAGVENTIIVAKYDRQVEMSRDLGASHIIMADDEETPAKVKNLTDGLGADAVIITITSDSALAQAFKSARRRATIVLVGGYSNEQSVRLAEVVSNEFLVRGSACYGMSGLDTDFESAIRILSSGGLPLDRTITHRFSLDQIAEAFRTSADKTTGAIKVLVCQ